MDDSKIKTATLIDIDLLHVNEWNPNEQSKDVFNKLVEEIKQDGFKDPLTVCPWKDYPATDGKIHYRIIGGEHRYKAGQVLEFKQLPCFIHEDWDELAQKLKTVKLNLLKGDLNEVKFTRLVKSLEEKYSLDQAKLAELMGFSSEKDLSVHIIKDKDRKTKTMIDALIDESKKETAVVSSLTEIISNILSDFGDTIDQNFLSFTYKGSLQSVVLCDKNLMDRLKKTFEVLKSEGTNANDFFVAAIDKHLKDLPEPVVSEKPKIDY
jgi:ParB/RepB/Spo0J family partition protein